MFRNCISAMSPRVQFTKYTMRVVRSVDNQQSTSNVRHCTIVSGLRTDCNIFTKTHNYISNEFSFFSIGPDMINPYS